ncbi:unnamed protein product, partial [Rotaria socialis]
MVAKAAENHLDSKVPIKKMNDLVSNVECILIGILFKQMVLKPSIVKQIATENSFNLQPSRTRYVDPTDKLILEEESQRIELNGNIDINRFVTGVAIAVHGYEDDRGVFIVKDYCFKDLSIPKKLSPPKEDKYILFTSGFLLSESSVIFNQLECLVNSLTQPTNIQSEQLKTILTNTIRFIVAGNSIESSNRLKDTTNQAKYLTRKMTASSVEAMHSIDELFDKIALGCYPYVKNDPFIITDTPHVFFAGNQPTFETRVFHGSNDIQVRLLCIPSFAQSNSCIALNLSTRECYEISFQNETP